MQTTEEDTREKGLLLPQRITDTFLKYADQIDFYHREEVNQDATYAAKWTREGEKGVLQVFNSKSYAQIKAIHNLAIEKLQIPELSWENTVEASIEQ